MEKLATEQEIRSMIMHQLKPFCLMDICSRIEAIKPANRGLILAVLNELHQEGLVKYVQLPEKVGNTEWAFVVDNDIIDLNKKIKRR